MKLIGLGFTQSVWRKISFLIYTHTSSPIIILYIIIGLQLLSAAPQCFTYNNIMHTLGGSVAAQHGYPATHYCKCYTQRTILQLTILQTTSTLLEKIRTHYTSHTTSESGGLRSALFQTCCAQAGLREKTQQAFFFSIFIFACQEKTKRTPLSTQTTNIITVQLHKKNKQKKM